MNKLIFFLILSTVGLCTALECYDCIVGSSDLGEVNDCGDNTDQYPTSTCDAEEDGARCIYIEVTNATTHFDVITRRCVNNGEKFCDVIYPEPGFNITNCYVCASDRCNRDASPPPSVTKIRFHGRDLGLNFDIEGIVYDP